MKVLITGSNGYIGRKVVSKFLEYGFKVVATDISNSKFLDDVDFVECDLFSFNGSIMEKFGYPDVCLHLAWKDGFKHNSDEHMNNLSNHYKFLNKCLEENISKIVVMGSMHEIGYWEGEVNNLTPTNPVTLYGIAKNSLRESLTVVAKNRLVWLRAFYIYGDDENNPSVFGKLRQAANRGELLFPINSGKNKYDFIHIDQLSKQIVFATIQSNYTGIINCCSGSASSLSEKLNEYITKNNLKIKLDYNKYPDREYDSPILYGDNSIIEKIEEEIKI